MTNHEHSHKNGKATTALIISLVALGATVNALITVVVALIICGANPADILR